MLALNLIAFFVNLFKHIKVDRETKRGRVIQREREKKRDERESVCVCVCVYAEEKERVKENA